MNRVKRVSFVVRLVQDRRGEISGVIERVATGAKEPFSGVEAIGQVMRKMLPGEQGRTRRGSAPRGAMDFFGRTGEPPKGRTQ